MPLDGWDHVELWVGNAKQAAYYYEHAFGFACTSYAGPETGVRDRASYVLEQSEIRLVISSSLRQGHEIGDFAVLHGDGVKDISLRVPDANEAYRQAVQRGARGIMEPKTVEDEFGKVVLATIGTYGDVVHTFVDRTPTRVRISRGTSPASRRRRSRGRVARARPRRRERRARPHAALGRVLRAGLRDDGDDPLQRRGHLDRVLRPDVEGDVGRPGEDQVPDQRAGRGEAQEPDRGVPRVQPRPRLAAHRDADGEHRRDGRGAAAPRRDLPERRPTRTTTRRRTASARSTRAGTTCAGCGSSPTATTTAICSRSSRRRCRTGRHCSSR